MTWTDAYGELTILEVEEFDFIPWSQAKSGSYLDRDGDLAFSVHSGCSHDGYLRD